MNLSVDCRNPHEFAARFIEEDYASLGRNQRVSVHKCAEYAWEWGASNASGYLGKANQSLAAQDAAYAKCYYHVRYHYMSERPALQKLLGIGWLSWIVIEAIISVLLQQWIKWFFFKPQRISRFAALEGMK